MTSQVVRPSDSPSGYRNTTPSHPLPPGTRPQAHLILRLLISPAPESWVGAPGHPVQRQGGSKGGQHSLWPSTAKHLAKFPPKRCLMSPGDSLSGKSYWNLTCFPKGSHVAKDPKVTLSFEQCHPTWHSRQKLPPSLKHEGMMGKRVGGGLSRVLVPPSIWPPSSGDVLILSPPTLPGSCPPPGVPSFAFACQPASWFSSSWEQRVPMDA